MQHPPVAVASPERLPSPARLVEVPRTDDAVWVETNLERPRSDRPVPLPAGHPDTEVGRLILATACHRHLLVLGSAGPGANEPVQVFEPVLTGPPLAGDGSLPPAARPDVSGGVESRRGQILA